MKGRKNINNNKVIVKNHINDFGASFFTNEWADATQQEIDSSILEEVKQQKVNEIKSVVNSNPTVQFTKAGKTYSYNMETQEMINFLQKALNNVNNNNFTLNFALESKNTTKQILFKNTEKANILAFLYEKINSIAGMVFNNAVSQYLFCGRDSANNSSQSNIKNSTVLLFNKVLENNGIMYNTTTGAFTLKAGVMYEIYCDASFSLTNRTGNASALIYMRLCRIANINGSYDVTDAQPSPTGSYIFSTGNISQVTIGTQFSGTFKTLFSPPTDGEYGILMKGDNAWTLSTSPLLTYLIVKSIGVKQNTSVAENEVNTINSMTTVEDIGNFNLSMTQVLIDFPETLIDSVIV